jgi:hypothetical protein
MFNFLVGDPSTRFPPVLGMVLNPAETVCLHSSSASDGESVASREAYRWKECNLLDACTPNFEHLYAST